MMCWLFQVQQMTELEEVITYKLAAGEPSTTLRTREDIRHTWTRRLKVATTLQSLPPACLMTLPFCMTSLTRKTHDLTSSHFITGLPARCYGVAAVTGCAFPGVKAKGRHPHVAQILESV